MRISTGGILLSCLCRFYSEPGNLLSKFNVGNVLEHNSLIHCKLRPCATQCILFEKKNEFYIVSYIALNC